MSVHLIQSGTPGTPPPKPHAEAASARLRDLADDAYAKCRVAAQALGQDIVSLRASVDVADSLRGAVHLMQGAAHLGAIAKQLAEALRPAIASEMERAGCHALPLSDEQQAVLADKARTAIVNDNAAIPARFWFTPDPRVDLDALAAALNAGEKIEGAELSPEAKVLSIRSRHRPRRAGK